MTQIASGLTDAEAFDISYHEMNGGTTVDEISQYIFDYGVTESPKPPYMYGSYTMYMASREEQQY